MLHLSAILPICVQTVSIKGLFFLVFFSQAVPITLKLQYKTTNYVPAYYNLQTLMQLKQYMNKFTLLTASN